MLDEKELIQIEQVIRSGGVIAYPTESVFGLGCDPFNKDAVMKLLEIKNRPVEQGLILIASNINQVIRLINPLDGNDLARALKTWPGHFTWIFPKSSLVPNWVSGSHNTIAIRVSKHPIVKQLCEKLGHAIVSTSANVSKQDDLKSIIDIKTVFNDKIQFYINAPTGNKKHASTIRDAHTLQIHR